MGRSRAGSAGRARRVSDASGAAEPARNVLALIGNTPLVRLGSFDTGPCELFVKLESQNPGGSIKDRIGLAMIEAAEQSGAIGPGANRVKDQVR